MMHYDQEAGLCFMTGVRLKNQKRKMEDSVEWNNFRLTALTGSGG